MDASTANELQQRKQQIRAEALRRRDDLANGESLSRLIFEGLRALPEYASARTLMTYLDVRSEVRTRWYLPTLWAEGKRVVVPYCRDDRLQLFLLHSLDELAPRTMQILEPRPEWMDSADRHVVPGELDFIIVPGLAFDRRGSRLGYGKGYYDRLLHMVRPDAAKVAVCFECQLYSEIPTLPRDIRMDRVVTEEAVYP